MDQYVIKTKGFELLHNLFNMSIDDGRIAPANASVLAAADKHIKQMYEYAQEAWRDKHFSEDQRKELTFMLKRFLDEVRSICSIEGADPKLIRFIENNIDQFHVMRY